MVSKDETFWYSVFGNHCSISGYRIILLNFIDVLKTTKVVHCKQEECDVYIGRPGIWGNPFTYLKDKKTKAKYIVSSREEAIEKYREWILTQPHFLSRLFQLKGKTLGCWCKPKLCHGDILIELIEKL
jgi:hypothetical protein